MLVCVCGCLSQGQQFASDVEEEANSYFQKIYSEAKPIEEVVAMLQRFKSSSAQRDQEVFACMIHNLFDEYRFFPRYPEKVGANEVSVSEAGAR